MKKLITLLFMLFLLCPQTGFCKAAKEPADYKKQYINLEWWERYNDPVLSGHVQTLYQKNHDLKIAALKVKEGEKLVKISFANELPELSFNGSLARNLKSSNLQFGNMMIPSFKQSELQLPLTMSYEVDIWGMNRFRTKSVEKQLAMIQQDERATYIALTSAFAAEYFNLIRVDELIRIQEQVVKIQEDIANKTQIKFENGLCTQNEVLNEQKALSYVKEELNNLKNQQSVLIHQLEVYLASEPGSGVDRAGFGAVKPLENIPSHFDSDVISNRPDFLRAENNIKRIGYDVKAARRDFLPKFVLYGQLGFNAYQFDKLFSHPAQMAAAGLLPQFDFFTGGRKMAILKLKKYEYEEAVEKYQKTILTTFQELNDALIGAETAQKNYEDSLKRFEYEKNLLSLLEQKRRIGAAADLDVLYGTERELLVQKEEVINKINLIISSINIYKAVGGEDLYKIVEHI